MSVIDRFRREREIQKKIEEYDNAVQEARQNAKAIARRQLSNAYLNHDCERFLRNG